MRFPRSVPGDKANHFGWGAIIAAVFACLGMVLSAFFWQHALNAEVYWTGAGAGVLFAFIAGLLKEELDERANDEARLRDPGAPPPHGVERKDMLYTLYGSVPVAVPLAFLAWLA